MIYDLNAVINVLTAGLMVWWSIVAHKRKLLPGYLNLAFCIAGFGWIGLYLYVLVFGSNTSSLILGRVFIRPLITLTLGAIAATLIYLVRLWTPKQ